MKVFLNCIYKLAHKRIVKCVQLVIEIVNREQLMMKMKKRERILQINFEHPLQKLACSLI